MLYKYLDDYICNQIFVPVLKIIIAPPSDDKITELEFSVDIIVSEPCEIIVILLLNEFKPISLISYLNLPDDNESGKYIVVAVIDESTPITLSEVVAEYVEPLTYV